MGGIFATDRPGHKAYDVYHTTCSLTALSQFCHHHHNRFEAILVVTLRQLIQLAVRHISSHSRATQEDLIWVT